MKLLYVILAIYMFNIPFGYWRANVKKFSFQWILAIHLPVPFVVLLRIYSDLGFELYTYPILIVAFFLGQFSGKKLFISLRNKTGQMVSSCLVMDYYRTLRSVINK